jgi:hypothetical protein
MMMRMLYHHHVMVGGELRWIDMVAVEQVGMLVAAVAQHTLMMRRRRRRMLRRMMMVAVAMMLFHEQWK